MVTPIVLDAIRRFHVLTDGQCIMKEHPASEDRSWMWQALAGGANQFAGRELHPLESSSFSRRTFSTTTESHRSTVP
jgi:hypothetical protein